MRSVRSSWIATRSILLVARWLMDSSVASDMCTADSYSYTGNKDTCSTSNHTAGLAQGSVTEFKVVTINSVKALMTALCQSVSKLTSFSSVCILIVSCSFGTARTSTTQFLPSVMAVRPLTARCTSDSLVKVLVPHSSTVMWISSTLSLSFQSKVAKFADLQNCVFCPKTLVTSLAMFGTKLCSGAHEYIDQPRFDALGLDHKGGGEFASRRLVEGSHIDGGAQVSLKPARVWVVFGVSFPYHLLSDLMVSFQLRWSASPRLLRPCLCPSFVRAAIFSISRIMTQVAGHQRRGCRVLQ